MATPLYHTIRRVELCALKVGDIRQREGVPHLRVEGKGEKVRHLPAAPAALRLIAVHLEASRHAGDLHGPLFRAVKNNAMRTLAKPLSPTAVYQDIVKRYARETGIAAVVHGVCVHSLRATAAANALAHAADIAEVQKWLGHADISGSVASFRWRAIWGMISPSDRGGGARESDDGELQRCPLCESDHPAVRALVSGPSLELPPARGDDAGAGHW